jgi:hypothetical protein
MDDLVLDDMAFTLSIDMGTGISNDTRSIR